MYCKGQCGFYPAVVHSVHSVHSVHCILSCVRLTAGLRTKSERKFLSCEISKGIVINRYFVKLNHCIVAIINFTPSKKSVLPGEILLSSGKAYWIFANFLRFVQTFFFFYSRKKLTYTSIPYLGTNLLRPLSPLNLSYSGKLLNFFSLTQRTFRLQLIFIFDYRLAFFKIGTIHPLN